MTLLLVMLGGAVGAPARFAIDVAVQRRTRGDLPWGTLVVNVLGSFVLGVLLGAASTGSLGTGALAFAATGFCGALTTFSTFGHEVVRLAEQARWEAAIATVLLSLALTLAVGALGHAGAVALLT